MLPSALVAECYQKSPSLALQECNQDIMTEPLENDKTCANPFLLNRTVLAICEHNGGLEMSKVVATTCKLTLSSWIAFACSS